jgi:hypothetical protein
VLLYAAMLVAFFIGSWVLDKLSGKPFDPARAAIMGLCLVAAWWGSGRILRLVTRRRH